MRRTNSERSVLLSNGGAGSRSGPPSGGGGGGNGGGGGASGANAYAQPSPYHLPHPSSSGGGSFYQHQHSLSGGGLPLHHGHPSLGALVGGAGYGGVGGFPPRRQGSGGPLLPRSGSGGGMAGALLSALQQPQQTALALLTGDPGGGGGGKGGGPPLPLGGGVGGGGGGGASAASSPLTPFVGWLRALLLLAVVGFVLLDVALFEAVVARTSSAPRSPALMADGVAGAGAAATAAAAGGLGGGLGGSGGNANTNLVNVGGLAAATPPPLDEDVDAALIELPKVLPSQAARLAAAGAGTAGRGAAAALQDAPTPLEGGKKKKHHQRHANPITGTRAPPTVTLLLQHGLLPPLPPQTLVVAAAAGGANAADLSALPAAFRLPPPTKPASVRALATSTVGPAPMIGLRAGAAAAANPSRAPAAVAGGGATSGGGAATSSSGPLITTEAARAAAVSLFGPDVFAAEERAAAGGGNSVDDDDDGEGGGKAAAAADKIGAKPKKPTTRRRLPPGFDWRAYLEYNPDVRAFGVNTAATAAGHYLAYGAKEGRLHRRIPLAVRYTACGGLANQHFSHVAALTLAVALGADALLPDAARRDTFAHYFSEDPTKNKVRWVGAELGSMWQVASAGELMRAAGNDAALAPNGTLPPDLSRPAEAFQTYGLGPAGVIGPGQVVRLEGVYLKALPLADLVDEARELAVRAAMAAVSGARQAAVARGERDADSDPRYDLPPPVILDLPCALFSVEALDSPLAAAVARQLRFSPQIARLADRVVAAIAAGGGGPPEEAAAASSALTAARAAAVQGAEAERRKNSGSDQTMTAPRTAAQLLANDPRFWRSGAGGFNGLHLRVEADARDWLRAMGGREAFWGAYLDLLREAGFGTDEQARKGMVAPSSAAAAAAVVAEAGAGKGGGGGGGGGGASAASAADPASSNLPRPGLPLYVATGLPSYAKPGSKAARSLDELRERLSKHGARLVLKEDVLPQSELSQLAPDQLALVDFLVLVRSRSFVGVSASTFSVLVREYRSLHGVAPRSTAYLVDSTPVGSEPLFARAAVFQTDDVPPVLGSHAKGGNGGNERDLL